MATTITRKIKVLSYSIPVRVPYVQNSNMIGLKFELEDFTIPSESTARVYVKKTSGAEVYNSATISSNTISFTPTTQMVAEVGEQPLQIQVTSSSGTVLVTFPIILDVKKNYISSSAVKSTNEYDTLTTLIKNANSAVSSANSAASSANTAASSVNTATTKANTAASSANTAASAANTAANSATSAASSANTAASSANTAAANANSVYEKVKDADFSTYATAITNTLSVTGATTSPQAKKVTNLTFTTPPESWSAGFLMGNRETNEVTLAGYGNFESTETSMDYVSQDSSLFGIVTGSNTVKLKRFRLTRLFGGIDFDALNTSAKTIIGAINELKSSITTTINTSLSKTSYKAGDSLTTTVGLRTSGYITTDGSALCFLLSPSRALDSDISGVSVSNLNVTVRQAGKYCYGSSASTSVSPNSIATTVTPFGIQFEATFSNTTNVTNNDACGVSVATGLTIKFS